MESAYPLHELLGISPDRLIEGLENSKLVDPVLIQILEALDRVVANAHNQNLPKDEYPSFDIHLSVWMQTWCLLATFRYPTSTYFRR